MTKDAEGDGDEGEGEEGGEEDEVVDDVPELMKLT